MAKKAKAPEATVEETIVPPVVDINSYEKVEVDSVVDFKLIKAKWYLTDTPIDKTSKQIRYPSPTDGDIKWFTKI